MSIEVKVSLEWLKQVHRDLDACQKVIWLAGCRPQVPGGFDPAYVTEAQARLAEIDAFIATGQQFAVSLAAKPALPPIDKALIYILGRPNFMCYGVAQSLRKLGHSIPNKTEDEQAHVIHWMLNSYLLHGEGWLGACNTEIASLNAGAGPTNE